MTATEFSLFATALGRCGIAWRASDVAGVQLPEQRDSATRARLLRRYPGAKEALPPSRIQQVIDNIAGLLRGEAREFSAVALDMQGVPPFDQRVYAVARTIPAGATLSYGEIAARLGDGGAAREVGQAMGQNPFPIIVPCHRVLAAGGKVGGFSAAGGVTTKLRTARDRGRTGGRSAHAVREASVGCTAGTPLADIRRARRSISRELPDTRVDATEDDDRARDELNRRRVQECERIAAGGLTDDADDGRREGKDGLIDRGHQCHHTGNIAWGELRLGDQGRERQQIADAKPEQDASRNQDDRTRSDCEQQHA